MKSALRQGQVGKVPESESPPGDALREFREAYAAIKHLLPQPVRCYPEFSERVARFNAACERLATTPEPGSPPVAFCLDVHDGWECTMAPGHAGDHVATVGDEECARWPALREGKPRSGEEGKVPTGSPGDVLVLAQRQLKVALAALETLEDIETDFAPGVDENMGIARRVAGDALAHVAALATHRTSQAAVPVGPLRDDGVLREILKRCTADYERTRRSNLNETLDAIEAQLLARLRHTGER